MACHLLAFCGLIGVPLGNIIGPLVIWLVKRDSSEFVNEQGKEVLNFQISITIYSLISLLLCLVFIGFITLGIILVAYIVLTIIGALKANKGIIYRYPVTIRFIK